MNSRFMIMVLMLVAVVGCSSGGKKGGGERVTAPHSVPELLAGLARAESRLGLTYRGDQIQVNYKVGIVKHKTGWWGETKTINGVTSTLGGLTYNGEHILLYTDPRTGKPHPFAIEHEMQRAVLYSHGIRTMAEQDAIMRKAGWRW